MMWYPLISTQDGGIGLERRPPASGEGSGEKYRDYFFKLSGRMFQACWLCNENKIAATILQQKQLDVRVREPRVVPHLLQTVEMKMSHLRLLAQFVFCVVMLFSVGFVLSSISPGQSSQQADPSVGSVALSRPYILDELPQHAPDEPVRIYSQPAILSETDELHSEIQTVSEFLIS